METLHPELDERQYYDNGGAYIAQWFESLKRSGRQANNNLEKMQMAEAIANGDADFKFHFQTVCVMSPLRHFTAMLLCFRPCR
jgi:hypothetical protein